MEKMIQINRYDLFACYHIISEEHFFNVFLRDIQVRYRELKKLTFEPICCCTWTSAILLHFYIILFIPCFVMFTNRLKTSVRMQTGHPYALWEVQAKTAAFIVFKTFIFPIPFHTPNGWCGVTSDKHTGLVNQWFQVWVCSGSGFMFKGVFNWFCSFPFIGSPSCGVERAI